MQVFVPLVDHEFITHTVYMLEEVILLHTFLHHLSPGMESFFLIHLLKYSNKLLLYVQSVITVTLYFDSLFQHNNVVL